MRWAVAAFALLFASGCADAPLAAGREPGRDSMPSAERDVDATGPTFATSGAVLTSSAPELLLASLPPEARGAVLDAPLNCVEAFLTDDDRDLFVEEVSVRLSWPAGSGSPAQLRLTVGNNSLTPGSAAGASPLWVNLTGDDSWSTPVLPLQVEVRPVFGEVVVLQETTLDVEARSYKPREMALRQAECVTDDQGQTRSGPAPSPS